MSSRRPIHTAAVMPDVAALVGLDTSSFVKRMSEHLPAFDFAAVMPDVAALVGLDTSSFVKRMSEHLPAFDFAAVMPDVSALAALDTAWFADEMCAELAGWLSEHIEPNSLDWAGLNRSLDVEHGGHLPLADPVWRARRVLRVAFTLSAYAGIALGIQSQPLLREFVNYVAVVLLMHGLHTLFLDSEDP